MNFLLATMSAYTLAEMLADIWEEYGDMEGWFLVDTDAAELDNLIRQYGANLVGETKFDQMFREAQENRA